MPNFVVIALAVSVAANLAGMTWHRLAQPRRPEDPWRTDAGWLIGVPLGFLLGWLILKWPTAGTSKDQQRFLTELQPLVIFAEVIVFRAAKPWLTALLRGLVAALFAPILLYKTTYLSDLAGPGSAEWKPAQAANILLAIAGVIALVWFALVKLQARVSDRTVAGLLALTTASAGLAVVMSGYLRGGLIGLIWAGAMLGASVATYWGPADKRSGSIVGIGLLGAAYVLLVGRFFGALDTTFALVIAGSPLLAWIAELPAMKSWPEGRRTVVRWLVVALPLAVVLTVIAVKFVRALADEPVL